MDGRMASSSASVGTGMVPNPTTPGPFSSHNSTLTSERGIVVGGGVKGFLGVNRSSTSTSSTSTPPPSSFNFAAHSLQHQQQQQQQHHHQQQQQQQQRHLSSHHQPNSSDNLNSSSSATMPSSSAISSGFSQSSTNLPHLTSPSSELSDPLTIDTSSFLIGNLLDSVSLRDESPQLPHFHQGRPLGSSANFTSINNNNNNNSTNTTSINNSTSIPDSLLRGLKTANSSLQQQHQEQEDQHQMHTLIKGSTEHNLGSTEQQQQHKLPQQQQQHHHPQRPLSQNMIGGGGIIGGKPQYHQHLSHQQPSSITSQDQLHRQQQYGRSYKNDHGTSGLSTAPGVGIYDSKPGSGLSDQSQGLNSCSLFGGGGGSDGRSGGNSQVDGGADIRHPPSSAFQQLTNGGGGNPIVSGLTDGSMMIKSRSGIGGGGEGNGGRLVETPSEHLLAAHSFQTHLQNQTTQPSVHQQLGGSQLQSSTGGTTASINPPGHPTSSASFHHFSNNPLFQHFQTVNSTNNQHFGGMGTSIGGNKELAAGLGGFGGAMDVSRDRGEGGNVYGSPIVAHPIPSYPTSLIKNKSGSSSSPGPIQPPQNPFHPQSEETNVQQQFNHFQMHHSSEHQQRPPIPISHLQQPTSGDNIFNRVNQHMAPHNSSIEQQVSIVAGRQTGSTAAVPLCSCCSEGRQGTSRCEDCREVLCANCVQAHYIVRMTREHRVVPLSTLINQQQQQQQQQQQPANSSAQESSGSSSLHSPLSPASLSAATNGSCPTHKEPLWLICETCARPLCAKCLHDHNGHSFGYLHKSNEPTLTTQLVTDAKQLQKCMEENAEAVERMTERVEARFTAVGNEIRAVLLHHISALEERKRDLLQRVDIIRAAKLSNLENQREDIKMRLTGLRTALSRADSLLSSGTGGSGKSGSGGSGGGTGGSGSGSSTGTNNPASSNNSASSQSSSDRGKPDSNSVLARELILEQLQMDRPHFGLFETDEMGFTAPEPALLETIQTLGAIRTPAHAEKSGIVGDTFRRVVRDRVAYFTVQARDAVGDPCKVGGDSVEVQISVEQSGGSCQADVQDRQNGTYLVSYRPVVDGKHVIRVTIRGRPIPGTPFTVHARKGRDYSNIGPQPLFSFGGEGTEDGQLCRPWGICVNRDGNLLVADRSNNRVQVFTKDGQFLYKFGSSGTRPGQFDRPAGLAINSKDIIIVADKDNHRIQMFTMEGVFESKFGEKGRNVGQFNYPWAVAVNSEDCIAVSDTRNHRVQLFSPNGQFIKKFGFDNSLFFKHFDSPRGVCFMPDGSLLSSDFNNHRLAVISVTSGEMKFYGREGDWDGTYKRPQGLDIDLEGHVIVTDSRNNRVQILSPELRFIGSFGWEGKDRTPLMDRPCDVCIHPDGRIFVVDFGNNKIHAF